jgi:hypothetical protein
MIMEMPLMQKGGFSNMPLNLRGPLLGLNQRSVNRSRFPDPLEIEDYSPIPNQKRLRLPLKDYGQTSDGRPSFTGHYDVETIKRIIDAAHKFGVDPNIALALSLQESGLGEHTEGYNPLRVFTKDQKLGIPEAIQELPQIKPLVEELRKYKDPSETYEVLDAKLRKRIEEEDLNDKINQGVAILKHKMSLHADKPLDYQIQAYAGLGQGYSPKYVKQFIPSGELYGKPVSGINPSIDLNHGKRVLDLLENVIKKSPELQEWVKEPSRAKSYMKNTLTQPLKKADTTLYDMLRPSGPFYPQDVNVGGWLGGVP